MEEHSRTVGCFQSLLVVLAAFDLVSLKTETQLSDTSHHVAPEKSITFRFFQPEHLMLAAQTIIQPLPCFTAGTVLFS